MDTNKKTLNNAVRQLPTYEPDEAVWIEIEQVLDRSKTLDVALESLPQYQPPVALWRAIEQEIQPAKRIALWNRNIFRVAASAVILIVASAFIINYLNQPKVEIVKQISHEVPAAILADWNEDETDFEQIEQWCKQYPFICNQAEVQTLREEIAELNEAKAMIEQAIGQYGNQARFVHEIKKIEAARSATLKAIAVKI